jgi:RNA-directed DNA polymerase
MENPASAGPYFGEEPQVPPGSALDRGMVVEKRTDDRPAEGGTLNSGGPCPNLAPARREAVRQQVKRGPGGWLRESDPPIVVGDGRTDHKAKGRTERQSGQSTHAGERITPRQGVSSTLSALRAKAVRDPKHRFRSLSRLLDYEMLRAAYQNLKPQASPGVDGVRHEQYGERLESHLMDLVRRLKEGRYRARQVKRRWIPKAGSQKLRPLGIPVLEDKIVQQAVKMILEAIWEPRFHDESIGYRAGRGARQASLELRDELNDGASRWVVEADIKGFFDHMDHGWLVRMLKEHIDDKGLIRLIVKWLKAGVLDEGRVVHPATGTPQGGVISPILANIYLHYVQDEWIKKAVSKHSEGRVRFRRYADDSVVCFESERDARNYLAALPERLGKFGLQLAEEKSALVRFERSKPEQSGKFTFLGFDFYWSRSCRVARHVYVRRRTNKKKWRASLLAVKEWIKRERSTPLPEMLEALKRKLRGYYNYYGVRGNSGMLANYDWNVKRLLFKWLNRRSQRQSLTWAQFLRRLMEWELPAPKVVEKPA